MKACKKWMGCNGITLQEVHIIEKGWRAALEWVKTQEACCGNSSLPCATEGIINQELEEN